MGRRTFWIAVSILIFTCSSESSAQTLISGRYGLDRNQSDDVPGAVANAAHNPYDINWPDLRRRIYKSSLPSGFLRISAVAGRIAVSDDSPRPIIDVAAGGVPMKWKINDGQTLEVSAKAMGEAVLLTYRGSDYERTTTYRNVGQQLVEDTTIESPRITTPIHYELVYKVSIR